MRLLLISMLMFANVANADHDKSKITDKIADELSQLYLASQPKAAVKPKAIVTTPTKYTEGFSESEINAIVKTFEERLIRSVTVLDRSQTAVVTNEAQFQQSGAVKDDDIQQLGNKYGATQLIVLTIKDEISDVDKNKEQATVSASIEVIDVKTQKKVVAKTTRVRYQHETSKESYYIRDTTSFVLGTTSVVSGIAAIGFGVKASSDKDKYKDATDAKKSDEADKWKKLSDRNETIAWSAGGICVTTLIFKLWLDSRDRNNTAYHDYELMVSMPRGIDMPEVGVAWNF